ncbi:hypothetical protein [Falsiroseomonas selenitidurans]|uniref:Uncharacterized protein n=1 Tax=Falsiroseomonas selenitidurans TaxID=2716335 RepID=A0ABX1DXR6_9PROT|nr:hypothetical protein [Falsiroseomonas selenitidurans]NKC29664.1 hypothetical protein [Falsiroseomonas selenitidurans]
MRRGAILAIALAIAAPALAPPALASRAEPLPLPPPQAPPLPGMLMLMPPPRLAEPAPMPNRSIEAPPDRFARPVGPQLEPTILNDRDRARGFTFGREHLSDRQEELFRDLAPGARLRIPLE